MAARINLLFHTMTSSAQQKLNPSEIRFEPASLVDPFGKVFYYRNDVYRAIKPERVELCRDLLKKSGKWEKYGLVKTKAMPFILEGYPLTIWHKRIEFNNYCSEWTPEMLRDAALLFLKFNQKLLKDGYICKDAHPWNIFFDYTRPIYIDIGSITPYEPDLFLNSMNEFILYFLLPLVLFKKKGVEHTYKFLAEPIPNHELRRKVADRMIDGEIYKWLNSFKAKTVLKRFRKFISTFNLDTVHTTEWSHYDQREVSVKRPQRFTKKQSAVFNFLNKCPPKDILDVGCNKGWFSNLAEDLGFRVVAFDNDIPAISEFYKKCKKGKKRILTLYNDFNQLTPAHGLNNVYPSFEERFSFSVVLAMAVVHHLSFNAGMDFDDIARRMKSLCQKYLIIEFIPANDRYVKEWDHKDKDWYTRQNFIKTFLKYFDKFTVVNSSPAPREVFLFSK